MDRADIANIVGRTLAYKKRGYTNPRILSLLYRDFGIIEKSPAVAIGRATNQQKKESNVKRLLYSNSTLFMAALSIFPLIKWIFNLKWVG